MFTDCNDSRTFHPYGRGYARWIGNKGHQGINLIINPDNNTGNRLREALYSIHVELESHLSPHAASTYDIAPARLARPWILYGPSEQSRWAPQLGQRSWHACMSIIVCPHMGHSFFLPATIHHAQGSASYYSFWQTRRLRPSGLCALAPRSPLVCLDSRCTL